ncbi:mRNA splicing protein [Basidiobolus ranarum]|uniref:Pre-mRNA-processing protein 45 n=1 Tax=Basidiobolus ranarum TaxID=34480 RepID=A0ABR2WUA8_9FUNG
MSSLSSVLPNPKNHSVSVAKPNHEERSLNQIVSTKNAPPSYRSRAGWIPRAPEDFGDGGAFPEIHVAQYPLNMCRKTSKGGNTISLQVDAEGNVQYDAIAKHGHTDSRIVHSHFKDLVPLRQRADVGEVTLDRPSEEDVQETADRTRAALEKIVQGKITASQPKSVNVQSDNKAQYIRYTPQQQSGSGGSGAKQRIIRMVEAPVDPMEPSKFKHKKIPRGPPSPPAPVMHSPPRKVTAEEQQAWIIPPCVSNWKNAKGYTIPLDKRLAADGRGIQEVKINDNFAKLSEALYAADRHTREEVRQRQLMEQKISQKQKAAQEEHLRMLAQRAREERSGISSTNDASRPSRPSAADLASSSEDEDDDRAKEREKIRRDKERERERELKLSRMGADAKMKYAAKSENRDISEKIALGLAKPSHSKESMFDSRLFNQNEGIGSGFKDDEGW